jgi:1D-myo-inositol-tetrakisphosphate 5-kinase/inositol-polyphosphate multikinase
MSDELKPVAQVGGHGAWDEEQRMMASDKGIEKGIDDGVKGQRELNFYKNIHAEDSPYACFRPFIAGFNGTVQRNGKTFLQMENLTRDFKKPCIMDIKIGQKTYGPDCSEEKAKRLDSAYLGTKIPFGFSVPGLGSYHGKDKSEHVTKDKTFGRELTEDRIDELLDTYFDPEGDKKAAVMLCNIFCSKLKDLLAMYENQTFFHLFASSILFVYDAEALLDESKRDNMTDYVEMRMIDFAHSWPAEGEKDENYLRGLKSLIGLFEGFLEKCA